MARFCGSERTVLPRFRRFLLSMKSLGNRPERPVSFLWVEIFSARLKAKEKLGNPANLRNISGFSGAGVRRCREGLAFGVRIVL